MRKLITVAELSKHTGIPKKTIRSYALRGLIRHRRNKANNYRMFILEEAIEDLKNLGVIAE